MFKCGTRIEMVLIYFSEPELEVWHRSKELANNDFYFTGRGLKVPKFVGIVGKDIVFRFIIEYSSLRDFGPY